VLLLKPRGFCAGVVRAIDIVKIALETFGAPIYVRREIVHNRYVVNELAEKGAIFVHEIDDVPDGQRVIYSAHGVSPAVREISKGRNLKVIDATCPLVTKVHIEAVKFAKQGYSLVLIGHRDHDEIEGTLGEAPEATQVVSNVAEVDALQVPNPDRVAYLTQTTLSLDEARDIIHALKVKFPNIAGPLPGHLLRHGEPAGCGAQRGARCGPGAGGGVDQQFELESVGGGLAQSGDDRVSD
jgi:4-hydroxy-3-methylbut-2-enyl diphosphate reductase